ncbi:hypothetical protein HHA33_01575 [Phytobacter diazotrophicus]|uniref:hypothetical protein n=1 Tax=Phytobacter diazotrophicus TaxID=395631 RepID=UPI0014519411|nr:hypothetical protein [Phytobacter diazotrophicus]QJF15298.1 hypothetical protein HHA33_01575 [Phytobacter diazotrophicus]
MKKAPQGAFFVPEFRALLCNTPLLFIPYRSFSQRQFFLFGTLFLFKKSNVSVGDIKPTYLCFFAT